MLHETRGLVRGALEVLFESALLPCPVDKWELVGSTRSETDTLKVWLASEDRAHEAGIRARLGSACWDLYLGRGILVVPRVYVKGEGQA